MKRNLFEIWKDLKDNNTDLNVTYFKPSSTIQLTDASLHTLVIKVKDDEVSFSYKDNKFDKGSGVAIKDAINMPDALKKLASDIESSFDDRVEAEELDLDEDEVER